MNKVSHILNLNVSTLNVSTTQADTIDTNQLCSYTARFVKSICVGESDSYFGELQAPEMTSASLLNASFMNTSLMNCYCANAQIDTCSVRSMNCNKAVITDLSSPVLDKINASLSSILTNDASTDSTLNGVINGSNCSFVHAFVHSADITELNAPIITTVNNTVNDLSACVMSLSQNYWTTRENLQNVISGSFINACITNASLVNLSSDVVRCNSGTIHTLSCDSLTVTNTVYENIDIVQNASTDNCCITNASIQYGHVVNFNVNNVVYTYAIGSNCSVLQASIMSACFLNASISNINVTSGNVSVNNVCITNASINNINVMSGNVSVNNVCITNASISNINVMSGNVSVNNVCITNASISNINVTSGNVSVNNVCITNASINNINVTSGNVSVNNVCITNASVNNACLLNASISNINVTSGNVSVNNACISNISCISGCITSICHINACITNASIINININSGNASLSNACITNASVINININNGNASLSNACITNLSCVTACITNISHVSACITNISCVTACITNISHVSACITNLSCLTACITSISHINACITNLSCINAFMSTATLTGNIYAYNGYYVGNVFTGYSDDRLKIRDGDISDCLAKLKSLSTFKYYPNTSVCKLLDVYSSKDLDIGMSAQEVQVYFPEVVSRAPCDVQVNESTGELISKTGQDFLTIRYERLTPIIIQAIKELLDLYETKNSRIGDVVSSTTLNEDIDITSDIGINLTRITLTPGTYCVLGVIKLCSSSDSVINYTSLQISSLVTENTEYMKDESICVSNCCTQNSTDSIMQVNGILNVTTLSTYYLGTFISFTGESLFVSSSNTYIRAVKIA